jgi:uncharacterized protein
VERYPGRNAVNLSWNGQERVPADLATVWAFVNDPNQIAQCLPDLASVNVLGAHKVDAVVNVAVGPVRGKFKFKITLDPQADQRHMKMKISGGGFGSVVDLSAEAALTPADDKTTLLDWSSTASIGGPVATVGGRVLDAQAERVISTTFANVKTRIAGGTAVG